MGIVGTLVVSVVAGLIVLAIWFWVRPYLQARQEAQQEDRLLRAFLDMVQEHPDGTEAPLSASVAVARARLRDPDAVLKRLLHKDHIRADRVYPNHFRLSFDGRRRGDDAHRRSFWRLLSGK